MDRAEHLQWAKDRANACVDKGNITDALASMRSDLEKQPDLERHSGIGLGIIMVVNGHLSTAQEMRDFINGFN